MGVPILYNTRNLVVRKATTLMTAVGIGLTVAVLVTSVALTAGLRGVFAESGDPRHLLVLRKGSDSELISGLSQEVYQVIRSMPGIARGENGEPLVSPEGVQVVNLPSVDFAEGVNVTVRGLLPVGLEMRSWTMVEGRQLEAGRRQAVVGESVARRYPSARLGNTLWFGRGEWEIVGVFRSGASTANSEIWVDLNQVRGDYDRQGESSSLLVRTEGPAATAPLANLIKQDQRLGASTMTEKEYYAAQMQSGLPLQILGFFVALIMAVGSAFAATNTMYAAVARRTPEIGTLRALGFSRWAILRSFVGESVLLALVGGVLGVLLALPLNGWATGIGNFATFSETTVQFRVGPEAMAGGLVFAAAIGLVGGFLPAWSASRKNMIQTMREV